MPKGHAHLISHWQHREGGHRLHPLDVHEEEPRRRFANGLRVSGQHLVRVLRRGGHCFEHWTGRNAGRLQFLVAFACFIGVLFIEL